MSQGATRGTCDACGKHRCLLTEIESGHAVCKGCLKALRAPKPSDPATAKQIAYARRLGFDVPDCASREEVGKLLALRELQTEVRYYVYDVWDALTGKRPRQSGVPSRELTQIVNWILLNNEALTRCISDIRSWQYDQASNRCDAEKTKIEQQLRQEFRGDPESNRFYDLLISRFEEVDFKSHVPRIPQDDVFRYVAAMLKSRFQAYLRK